jgi:hypothetical protein
MKAATTRTSQERLSKRLAPIPWASRWGASRLLFVGGRGGSADSGLKSWLSSVRPSGGGGGERCTRRGDSAADS